MRSAKINCLSTQRRFALHTPHRPATPSLEFSAQAYICKDFRMDRAGLARMAHLAHPVRSIRSETHSDVTHYESPDIYSLSFVDLGSRYKTNILVAWLSATVGRYFFASIVLRGLHVAMFQQRSSYHANREVLAPPARISSCRTTGSVVNALVTLPYSPRPCLWLSQACLPTC